MINDECKKCKYFSPDFYLFEGKLIFCETAHCAHRNKMGRLYQKEDICFLFEKNNKVCDFEPNKELRVFLSLEQLFNNYEYIEEQIAQNKEVLKTILNNIKND